MNPDQDQRNIGGYNFQRNYNISIEMPQPAAFHLGLYYLQK